MDPETMIADASYTRSRIHAMEARRRLVANAAPGNRAPRHGLRYRTGAALVAAGSRLQRIASSLPEPPSLREPTTESRLVR